MDQEEESSDGEPFIGSRLTGVRAGGFTLGRWWASRDDHVEAHGHGEAHFVQVTAGWFHTEAASDVQAAGTVVFNPAQTFHADHFVGGAGAFFTVASTPALDTAFNDFRPPTRAIISQPRVQALFQRLAKECVRWSAGSALIAESGCLELFSAVCATVPTERTPPRWLTQACELLRDQPVESVEEVARLLGVHPVHLTRTFRRFHGCTPGEYQRSIRLTRAAALIHASRRPLAEIAFDCGFTDQSHLTHEFRAAHGVTPGAYRRLIA